MAFTFRARPGRLDAVVASELHVPRADAQRAIAAGRVLVDGAPRAKSHRLQGGERIEGDLLTGTPPRAEREGVPVRYEDYHLLVVAKPAGMLTHPTPGTRAGTLVNRLLGMGIPLSTVGGEDRPGIVHRLDAGTSGLLIVAKDDETHRAMAAMLAEHRVERRYSALVRGRVDTDRFTIDAPLARRLGRVTVSRPGGVASSTEIEVLERLAGSTLVEARPRTGRTHQIRVHLSSVGYPVLGDRRYGGGGDDARRLGLSRPFLHARAVSFEHPATGEPISVEEPLPLDLEKALAMARRG